jgi:hypothetical protein
MNTEQVNFLNMTNAVLSGMDADTEAWTEKKPIADAVIKIKGHKSELEGLAFEQASGTTNGATENLQSALKVMLELTHQVIKKVRPFTRVTGKADLLHRIDFSRSELDRLRQVDALNQCKIVLETSRQLQPEMTDYELSVEDLDALQSAINGVAMLAGERDAIIGSRKTATEGIPEVIDQIRKQFDILDDLVPAMIDDKTFVNTYQNNRRIIDR